MGEEKKREIRSKIHLTTDKEEKKAEGEGR